MIGISCEAGFSSLLHTLVPSLLTTKQCLSELLSFGGIWRSNGG